MPATITADTIFFELVPPFEGTPRTRPTCPDGSGDLWWDQESYIRYQSDDYGDDGAHDGWLEREFITPDYCDGIAKAMDPNTWDSPGLRFCDPCRARYDARFPF